MPTQFPSDAPREVWEELGLEYPGLKAPPKPQGQPEAPREVWEELGLQYPGDESPPQPLEAPPEVWEELGLEYPGPQPTTAPTPEPEPQIGALQAAGRGLMAGTTGLAHGIGVGTKWLGEKIGPETALGGFLVERGESARQYWNRVGEQFAPPPGLEIGGLMDSPERMANASWWTYNLGQMMPSLTASIIPGAAAYKAIRLGGQAFHWSPVLANRLAMVGAAVTGGVTGGSLEGAGAYEEVLRQGGTEQQAIDAYEYMSLASAGLNAIGLMPIFNPVGGRMLTRFLVGGGVEGLTEWAEEPTQAGIISKIRTGEYDLEAMARAAKESVGVIPIAGIMGGGAAVISGAAQREEAIEPEPTPEAEQAAVRPDEMAGRLRATQIAARARKRAGAVRPGELTAEEQVAKYPQAAALEAAREVEGRMRAEFGETAPEVALLAQTVPAPGAVNEPLFEPPAQPPPSPEWTAGAANRPTHLMPSPTRAELLESTTEPFGDRQARQQLVREERVGQEPGRPVQQPVTGAEAAEAGRILQAPEARQEITRQPEEGEAITEVAPSIDQAAHEAATSPLNERPPPTEAQIAAGNYKKGTISVGGMRIKIENPAGSQRRPEWPVLKSHYGYIRGTKGKDKDRVDVFIGPEVERAKQGEDIPVYVIQQQDAAGQFDEYKVMLGYRSLPEAREAYLENYTPEQRQRIGRIKRFATLKEFKEWVQDEFQTTRAMPAPTEEEATEMVREDQLQNAEQALAAQDKKIDALNAILRCLQT